MRKGFTLAEVLISLAIIGVIASLTLPSLNVSVQKQKVGSTLMKAINTLENANKVAMAENDARYLSSVWTNGYGDVLSKYVAGAYSGSNYKSNDGIEYIIGDSGSTEETASNYVGTYQIVDIDINGAKNPNIFGKDRFRVYVDMNGSVIPYGGVLYQKYINKPAEAALWTTKCNKDTVTDNTTCTGSIIDNGGNVIYEYQTLTAKTETVTPGTGTGLGGGKGTGGKGGKLIDEPTIGGGLSIDDGKIDDGGKLINN